MSFTFKKLQTYPLKRPCCDPPCSLSGPSNLAVEVLTSAEGHVRVMQVSGARSSAV